MADEQSSGWEREPLRVMRWVELGRKSDPRSVCALLTASLPPLLGAGSGREGSGGVAGIQEGCACAAPPQPPAAEQH
jgi:hypothetical protein